MKWRGVRPGSEVTLDALATRLRPFGLVVLGGFAPNRQDRLPALAGERQAASVALIGNAGSALWEPFDTDNQTGHPDPLDFWTAQCIGPIADEFSGRALYPFAAPGEAHWPFQQWVMRAAIATPSPLGILIHPVYGLWFALRAALLLPGDIVFPGPPATNPCEDCAGKPCLDACPVAAFSPSDHEVAGSYDVAGCREFLRDTPDNDCMSQSCRARRACPVGQDFTYAPAHAAFHMKAFV